MNVNKHSLYGPRALDNRITNSANTLGPKGRYGNVNNYGVTDRQHSTVNPNVKVIEVTPE